jgi:hypothetical protein
MFAIILFVIDIILYAVLCLVDPSQKIEKSINFPYKKYKENKEKYGDHSFKVV